MFDVGLFEVYVKNTPVATAAEAQFKLSTIRTIRNNEAQTRRANNNLDKCQLVRAASSSSQSSSSYATFQNIVATANPTFCWDPLSSCLVPRDELKNHEKKVCKDAAKKDTLASLQGVSQADLTKGLKRYKDQLLHDVKTPAECAALVTISTHGEFDCILQALQRIESHRYEKFYHTSKTSQLPATVVARALKLQANHRRRVGRFVRGDHR